MFDKFLKRVEKFSDLAKNSKIIVDQVESTNTDTTYYHNQGNTNQKRNNFSGNSNYANKKNNFKENTFKKEYQDDGSYFCSYAIGGNTLICYKNNEKLEINLAGIEHPDKNHFLAKRANYFLNDLVKKKKLILKDIGNNLFEAFLIDNPTQSINQLMIEEGFHSSVPYAEKTEKAKPFEKFKNNDEKKSVTNHTDSSIDKKVSEKNHEQKTRNFAYGLFAKDAETFEAMFNNKKITCKIDGLDITCFTNETKKKIKNIIYEFVSKKSIILDIKKEENDIFYVVVTNKFGENLNEIIFSKDFPKEETTIENPSLNNIEKISPSVTEDVTTEDDWNWVNDEIDSNKDSSSEKNTINNETDIPEISSIPKMFQKKPKSDSPFSRIRKGNISTEGVKAQGDLTTETDDIENIIEQETKFADNEIDIPEISNIPKMFQNKPKSDSPFSRIRKGNISTEGVKAQDDLVNKTNDNNLPSESNSQVKKKLSFGKR